MLIAVRMVVTLVLLRWALSLSVLWVQLRRRLLLGLCRRLPVGAMWRAVSSLQLTTFPFVSVGRGTTAAVYLTLGGDAHQHSSYAVPRYLTFLG